MTQLQSNAELPRQPGATRNLEQRSHFLMLMATLLVSTSFPVGAAITDGLDPLVLTFLRFALAALLLAPLVAWRYSMAIPGWRDLVRYSVLSALLVAFFWSMFTALRYTSALNTATIFALAPSVTAATSALLLREKLAGPARMALLLGMVGAVWVIFSGDLAGLVSLEFNPGDGIFLAGTVALGIYGTLVKYLHRGEPMARMTFWTLLTGAVWLFVLSVPRWSAIGWSEVPVSVFAGIAYLAIFTTLVTFFVFQWSATIIGPTKVVSYTYLNPAFVLVIGMVLGNDLPPPVTYPGLVLVVTATFVLQSSGLALKLRRIFK